jgi:hypothetical protein
LRWGGGSACIAAIFKRLSRKSDAGSRELSGGCLSLFGLPFFIAGMVLTVLYLKSYSEWWRAAKWVEVPCVIESVGMKRSDGTSRTVATFRYELGGREYRGDQVSLYEGSDNIGSFQRDVHRELREYVLPEAQRDVPVGQAEKVFRCYVDPSRPSEAVLYRTLRWPMQVFMATFALTFPAVGAGLVLGGIGSMRRRKTFERLRLENPEMPWKWRPAWAGTRIPEEKGWVKILIYSYTFWFWFMVLPLLYATAASGAFASDPYSRFVLILPAIGLVPLVFSIKHLRHRLMMGKPSLMIDPWPAEPGYAVNVGVLLPKTLSSRCQPELTLECVKSTTVATGDGDSTTSDILWSEPQSVPLDSLRREAGEYRLPARFVVPADAAETTADPNEKASHAWKLHLRLPGTPVHSVFELPVFRSGMLPPVAMEREVNFADGGEATLAAFFKKNHISAEYSHDGSLRSFHGGPRRFWAMLLLMFFFNVIWTGITVYLFRGEAPWMFRAVWSVSATGIWIYLIWGSLRWHTVRLENEDLEVLQRWGPIRWRRRYPRASITGFTYDTNLQSNGTAQYRVRFKMDTGKQVTLLSMLPGQRVAAALTATMEKWRGAA